MTNPDAQTPVKLPVIYSFAIEGYQLFPGEDGSGIRHNVSDGVTIIVGLNGLGKTTLLNALYRCLTGPVHSGLMTLFNLGSQKPGLLDYRAADYFGNRVEDGAREATIELSVRFGGDELRIRRNLRTLNLTHLECRGIAQEPHEQAYRDRVIELANLPRFEDFLVLLHYVVFVFEDRPKLIWDSSAQAELFRFVVNPASAATQYRTAFDRIASLDSERRNLRVQANRLRKQIDKARAAGATNRTLQARVDMLTTDVEGVKKAMDEVSAALVAADGRRRQARENLLRDEHEARRAQEDHLALEQRYLRSIYPSAGEVASQVLVNAQEGCLICGDRTGAAIERVRSQVAVGRCPFCDQEPPADEPSVGGHDTTLAPADLERASGDARTWTLKLMASRDEVRKLGVEHGELSEQLNELLSQFNKMGQALSGMRRQLPPDEDRVKAMARQHDVMTDELEGLKRDQALFEGQLESLVADTRQHVDELKDGIADRFNTYAGAFLQEACNLVYDPQERPIGQEGKSFSFPSFHVDMTSALSPEVGRTRSSAEQVSESQKEFIDLAFRMALIETLGSGTGAMIVLETPEASLDRVFAVKAGAMFGQFARSSGGSSRLIATSNVTDGPMIGAMLGVHSDPDDPRPLEEQPQFVPPVERQRHMVNLLRLAAENAALRRYRETYEETLKEAIGYAGD
jgi:hypothetical protein